MVDEVRPLLGIIWQVGIMTGVTKFNISAAQLQNHQFIEILNQPTTSWFFLVVANSEKNNVLFKFTFQFNKLHLIST